jgi:transcriptional regulator with XRE-family HTH domain
MPLVERIQDLCDSKGINLSNLQKDLGFSNGTIYRWNTSMPSADRLLKVAQYFDVTVDYLLGKEKNNTEIITTSVSRYLNIPLDEPKTLKIMCKIALLNKTNQAIISDMIDSMIKNQE